MKEPTFNYDENADVMYISFGKPEKCTSKDIGPGIIIRHTPEGKLNGITIIDYRGRTS